MLQYVAQKQIIRRASIQNCSSCRTILSKRKEFTPEEEISLKHLIRFLGSYDKYFVVPESLQIIYPDFGIKRFDEKFFGTALAHTRLIFSPDFYETFADYMYILIYNLDSLVFSDQLAEWCEMGFDYIGAPCSSMKEPLMRDVGILKTRSEMEDSPFERSRVFSR